MKIFFPHMDMIFKIRTYFINLKHFLCSIFKINLKILYNSCLSFQSFKIHMSLHFLIIVTINSHLKPEIKHKGRHNWKDVCLFPTQWTERRKGRWEKFYHLSLGPGNRTRQKFSYISWQISMPLIEFWVRSSPWKLFLLEVVCLRW